MDVPYRYAVRTMRGSSEIEAELGKLSEEGWEPINFERDASGSYEVILRRWREDREHTEAVLEHLEVTSETIASDLSHMSPP
ncbi:MAG: hypothetical protein M3R35_04495 [Candidatus Eremiobacteraeota bacterium]|nr:hypothetical protein [Candidatus Eremiobacteraeota bacterium]